MSDGRKDDRPPLVIALAWVQQITAVALEMALPAWLGYWLDQRWGTEPWLVILGAALGFVVGMTHLMKFAASAQGKNSSRNSHDNTNGNDSRAR